MNKDWISTSVLYGPYLAHHGIKGMKWGIRRYQNPDGTLTEEGKRRYDARLKKQNEYQRIIDSRTADITYDKKILKDAKKRELPSSYIKRINDSIETNSKTINAYQKRIDEIKNTPIDKTVSHERVANGKRQAIASMAVLGAATMSLVALEASQDISFGKILTTMLVGTAASTVLGDKIAKRTLERENKKFTE